MLQIAVSRHRSPRFNSLGRRSRSECLRPKAWIKRFIFFHNKRHPLEMGEPEINAFLSGLAVKERVSASTQNQALCALFFLYRNVLEPPNTALHRTPAAVPPSPVSFQPFGAW